VNVSSVDIPRVGRRIVIDRRIVVSTSNQLDESPETHHHGWDRLVGVRRATDGPYRLCGRAE